MRLPKVGEIWGHKNTSMHYLITHYEVNRKSGDIVFYDVLGLNEASHRCFATTAGLHWIPVSYRDEDDQWVICDGSKV